MYRAHGLLSRLYLFIACTCFVLSSREANAQVVVEVPKVPATKNGSIVPGPLHNYIAKPDDSFGYELAESGSDNGCYWLRYNVTSQTWQGIVWRHVLWIILPATAADNAIGNTPDQISKSQLAISGDSAVLFIGGGSWKNDWSHRPPQNLSLPREYETLSSLAKQSQSPVVLIEQVPFQPILDGRFEDAIIAETFKRYIMGEGEDWPLLLPMVKSAVRAMDVAQQQLQDRFELSITKFTVSGASKRGWTTWLTAAVDDRVDAIAPIVIDMLNMQAQMKHQMEVWGKYSEEIQDYTALNLQRYLETPRGQELQGIVDPYSYRSILDIPKLLIFGTNDRYWTLDACNIYWDDLVGPKNIMYVPNNGHGIKDLQRIVGSLAALHRSRKNNTLLPDIRWSYQANDKGKGKMVVSLDSEPKSCALWLAKSPTKDFRNASWISIPMFEQSPLTYAAAIEPSKEQHVAFFAEVLTKDEPLPGYLSSNVTILYSDVE